MEDSASTTSQALTEKESHMSYMLEFGKAQRDLRSFEKLISSQLELLSGVGFLSRLKVQVHCVGEHLHAFRAETALHCLLWAHDPQGIHPNRLSEPK